MSHSVKHPALLPPESDAVAPPASGATTGRWLFVASAFLLLWAEVANHLRAEWSANPQYEYGWLVPFLALYLFSRRWLDRPAPAKPTWPKAALLLAIVSILPLLPARIISIANPDWRLLSWGLALAAFTTNVCGLYLAGGSRWVRHFGFAAAFLLVATPWPVQLEQAIVQDLMRADAAAVVKVLNFLGTFAMQRGNVIELKTGLVGIADACTGIRSLQSTLMISIFLGELYRLKWKRRVGLVIAAASLAFVFNLLRTLFLCLIASTRSLEAMHGWHDSAGLTILILCIVALWILSLGLRARKPAPTRRRSELPHAQLPWLRSFAIALLVWIGITEVSAAAWYRANSSTVRQATSWSVSWPTKENAFAEITIPQEARDLLSYDSGGGATWKSGDGHQWLMYHFQWFPGRTAARFVKVHRPDVCLPASGMVLTHDGGISLLQIDEQKLPVRAYRFTKDGVPIDVFYSYYDSRVSYESEAAANEEDWSGSGRLRAALQRRRETGAQMLELVAWGYASEAEAAASLEAQLKAILRAH